MRNASPKLTADKLLGRKKSVENVLVQMVVLVPRWHIFSLVNPLVLIIRKR